FFKGSLGRSARIILIGEPSGADAVGGQFARARLRDLVLGIADGAQVEIEERLVSARTADPCVDIRQLGAAVFMKAQQVRRDLHGSHHYKRRIRASAVLE